MVISMELILLIGSASLFVFSLMSMVLTRVMRDGLRKEKRLAAFAGAENKEDLHRRARAENRKAPIRISTMMADQIASSGVPIRAEEFVLIWILLAFLPPLGAGLLGARFFPCLLLSLGGLALPPLYVRQSRKKRVRAFEAQLGDALVSISNCLKSGLTFQQGMGNVAEQMPEPISREFARVLREVQLGNTMETALNNLTRRIPSPDLKLMITAILISQQVGGSLSEVLDNIAQTITDRLKVKAEIHTLTSTGRMSGLVIGCLPIGIALMLSVINPAYMRTFITTESGRVMLMVAAGMEIVGFFVIRKMVTVKY